MTETSSESATMSVREAHQLIGPDKISLNALYRAVQMGQVPSIKCGSRVLIPRAWIIRQLAGKGDRRR
jgi:hypothetical protein